MAALAPPRRLIEDMAWCWWTRPRAARIGDRICLAAVDSAGGMIVAALDLKTGAVQRERLAQFEADDHNNPALLVVPRYASRRAGREHRRPRSRP